MKIIDESNKHRLIAVNSYFLKRKRVVYLTTVVQFSRQRREFSFFFPGSPTAMYIWTYGVNHIISRSHWDDRCRPRRPLYPRNKCLSYDHTCTNVTDRQTGQRTDSIGRTVFSEREVTFTFAICTRLSVCRLCVCLSVTLVRPSQAVEIFSNISTALYMCLGHPLTSTKNITEIVPGEPTEAHKGHAHILFQSVPSNY